MTAEIVEAIAKAEKEQELKREEERKAQIEAEIREKKREQALLDEQKAKEEQRLKEENLQREKALKQEQKSKENLTGVQKKEQEHLAEIQALKQEVERKEAEAKALKAEKLRREEKEKEAEEKAKSLPKRQIIKFDMDSYSRASFFGNVPFYVQINVVLGGSVRNSQNARETGTGSARTGPIGGSGGYELTGENFRRNALTFFIQKLYTISNFTIVVMETKNLFDTSQTIKFNSIKLADELGREHEAACVYNISTGGYNDGMLSLGRREEKVIAFIFPRSKLRKLFFRIHWCGNSATSCQDVDGWSEPYIEPGIAYSPQELPFVDTRR
ncbi:MAG: hypothetical protein ABIB72_00475 [Candidatus Falkowbacteria bacterium]